MPSIEDFMLPCLNKKLLGIDCLGCGMQRSMVLIIKGDFILAFKMYPAIYTLILLFGFVLLNAYKDYKFANKVIITLVAINLLIIIGNYILKFYN
jgi:hypothetical protein